MPDARKIPNAPKGCTGRWVFPSISRYKECQTGIERRHLHETVVQRSVRMTTTETGIPKRVTCHTFRHSFATELLDRGHDIRTFRSF